MKQFLIILSAILFVSCTITKKIPITTQSIVDLQNYYNSKNINNFLYTKDMQQFVKLSEADRNNIPQNFIFDQNGLEIAHEDEKLCSNQTLTFLKNFNDKTKIKNTSYRIEDYLSHFKSSSENVTIESIVQSKKIRIFLNAATYAEKTRKGIAASEAFEIYKTYNSNAAYEIYLVNLDVLSEWKQKP
jgi:hypothetical protein